MPNTTANQKIANFVITLDNLDLQNKRIPGLILSHPGFGKTTVVRLIADYLDYNLVTIIPTQNSTDDILGIQSVKDGELVRLTPYWFNDMLKLMENGKRTLLFIDEITTCDPYIQGPLLDLIFSRNLGKEKLPDNCFIISAGNYSDDLNNEFKMLPPLVNRFLLLNLNVEDFSIKSIIDNDISSIKTKDKIKEFLNLNFEKSKYSYLKLKKWFKNSDEIQFNKPQISEDQEIGLLGFTSIRSLSFSMTFAEEYFKKFNDDVWIRIIGDSLGKSKARSDNIPIRLILSSVKEKFIDEGFVNGESPDFESLVAKFDESSENFTWFINHEVTPELIREIADSLEFVDFRNLSHHTLFLTKKMVDHLYKFTKHPSIMIEIANLFRILENKKKK